MPGKRLRHSWRRTESELDAARGLLPGQNDPDLEDYQEYIEHNELGLALDVLADVAARQDAQQEVWGHLAVAAEKMKLKPDDIIHGGTVRLIEDRLR